MEIHVSQAPSAHVIRLSGRWDAFSSPAFEQSCSELIGQDMRNVVLDLSGVDYVSSFGLRGLLNIGKQLAPLGGSIRVSALRPQVRKVFAGSGFNSLFPEYPDKEALPRAFITDFPVLGIAAEYGGKTWLFRTHNGAIDREELEDLTPLVSPAGEPPRWRSLLHSFPENGPHAAMLYAEPLSGDPQDGWAGLVVIMPWIRNTLYELSRFSNAAPFFINRTRAVHHLSAGQASREGPQSLSDEARLSGATKLASLEGHPRRRLGRGAAPADLQRQPPAVAAAVGRPHLAGLRAPAGTGLASRPARLQPRTGRRAARTAPAVPAGGDPRPPVHRAADMDGHLAHAPSPARPDRRHRPARRRRSGHAVPAFAVPRRGGRDAGRLRAGPHDPAGLLPQPRGQRRRPAAAEQRTRHRQKNPEVHVAPRLSQNAGRAAPGKHRHGPRSLRRSVRMLRGPGAPVLRHGRRLRQGRARRPFPVRFPAARPSPCRGPGNSCSASGRSNGIRRSRWNSRRDSPCCCTRTARTKPSARPTPRAANSTATSVLPRPSQWKGRRPVRRGIPAPAGSERRPALYDGRRGSREGTRTSGSPSPARTPPPLREWCGCRLFSMLRPRRRRPAPPRRPDRRESPGNPRRSAPATACRRRRRSR